MRAFFRGLDREPAQLAGLCAGLIQIASATFYPLTVEQQGELNAAVVALLGFITAWRVLGERAMPALAGLIQALMALALAFGVHLDPAVQSSAMAFVSALSAWFVRTQVTARGGPPPGRHSLP